MKLTTKHLIRTLPFENDFRESMLSKWDSFSKEQRFDLERIIWETYADIYRIKFTANRDRAIRELAEGKESFDNDLYKRVREKTDKEFEQMFQQTVPVADLEETREELHDILSEATKNIDNIQAGDKTDTPE